MRMVRRYFVLSLALSCFAAALGPSAQASPGIVTGGFHVTALNADGTMDTVAGSHPYELTANFRFNSDANEDVEGNVRDIAVDLPPGLIGNPTAIPRCSAKDFDGQVANCPADTQVGTFFAKIRSAHEAPLGPKGPVYNLVPPAGVAASLGFSAESFTVIENARLIRGGAGGYRVSVVTNNVSKEHLLEATETIWGVPADGRHDEERECVVESSGEVSHVSPCSTEASPVPFLTLPTSCAPQLPSMLEVDFVEALGTYYSESSESPQLLGCEGLAFQPSITVQPETSSASTATGLHVDVHMPQEESAEGRAEADLKDVEVTLPEGLVINPSAANGREACSSTQIALESTTTPSCPTSSKIGTVEVHTPLIDHPLKGTVYLAAQNDNPFHGLLAIYLVIEDEATGVIVKLPGHVEPNSTTGQLKTTFSENPQFPFEDFRVDLEGGQRAPLITPETCGTKTTETQMTPWTYPEHGAVNSSYSFSIATGVGGAGCVNNPAQAPNSPSFEAGDATTVAGAYSPFVLDVNRSEGSQPISRIEVVLPSGLSGKLAGVGRCSDEQIAAASAPGRTGLQEEHSPSCPAASEIGIVSVAAGAGSEPVHVTGHAYLAGPYEGAPFSVVIITPAVAGPFDLGTVVVRSALIINPVTAQVTVRSDPLPTILDGILLDVRSIHVYINRNQFTLNPTSCEHFSVAGIVTSIFSQPVSLSSPFQVSGCAGLPFKPAFSPSTQAKTSKANGAALHVKVTQPPGQANIAKVHVSLPKALPSRLTTLQKACVAKVFENNPANCPHESIVGSARAVTTILNGPLVGPAFFVSYGNAKFPELVILLQGEGITIQLNGETLIKNGVTSSTFAQIPDAPVSSFELELPQGRYSALTANGNLCNERLLMPTELVGHNGAVIHRETQIEVQGCSTSLSISGHKLKNKTITLSIYAPEAGEITAGGNGLHSKSKTADGREVIKLSLGQKHLGRLQTKIKVVFIPKKKGKKQSKTLNVAFRR